MSEPEAGIRSRDVLLRALRHALPALLLVYVFLLLFVPLADPDFFWHLKTGQRILETGELPGGEDPFSYTSPRPLSDAQVEGLRSQWLGQVFLYAVYRLGGYPGLIVFRSLLILIPFVASYVIASRRGLSPLWTVPVLLLPMLLISFSLQYAFERPQAFTVVFSFALVPLLFRLRRPGGRWPWVVLLVVMMALWSNLHGGFIFGVVMIAAFAFGVVVEAAATRRKEELFIILPSAAAIAASLLNPNTYRLLHDFLRAHLSRFVAGPSTGGPPGTVDVVGQILEYKPLWFFYRELHLIWPLFMVAFIALSAAMLVVRYAAQRRVRLPEALLAAAIVVFSLYYARGSTLGLVALPLFLAYAAGDLGKPWRLASGAAAAVLCAALLFITVQRSPWQLRPTVPPDTWIDASYPEGAVNFIKENELRGPMFNDFRWGGYLIWRLYPEYKVFIDGRLVSNPMLDAYMFVTKASPGAMRELDAFGVNFILTRIMVRESGVVAPLILRFLETGSGEWRLVYVEGNTALFVRNRPQNRRIIDRYGLPDEVLYGSIYAEAESLLAMMPGHPNALISMAVALGGLERYDDAMVILMSLPPSPARDSYLERFRRLRRQ